MARFRRHVNYGSVVATLGARDVLVRDPDVDLPTTACQTAQAFVRIVYQTVTGAQGSEHLVRTGQNHGFYVEIN